MEYRSTFRLLRDILVPIKSFLNDSDALALQNLEKAIANLDAWHTANSQSANASRHVDTEDGIVSMAMYKYDTWHMLHSAARSAADQVRQKCAFFTDPKAFVAAITDETSPSNEEVNGALKYVLLWKDHPRYYAPHLLIVSRELAKVTRARLNALDLASAQLAADTPAAETSQSTLLTASEAAESTLSPVEVTLLTAAEARALTTAALTAKVHSFRSKIRDAIDEDACAGLSQTWIGFIGDQKPEFWTIFKSIYESAGYTLISTTHLSWRAK